MTKRKRRNHSPALKAKVALEALKEERTLVELSQRFDIHQNLIIKWKRELLDRAQEIFTDGKGHETEVDVKELHAKIGQLTIENDFLSGALGRIAAPSAKK